MPTSTSNVFGRVNRRRPCKDCGRPDWRSFVRNGERISICTRISDGARMINRHGGAIFIHDDWREEKGIGVRVAAKNFSWDDLLRFVPEGEQIIAVTPEYKSRRKHRPASVILLLNNDEIVRLSLF
jgi:hypothetical protein